MVNSKVSVTAIGIVSVYMDYGSKRRIHQMDKNTQTFVVIARKKTTKVDAPVSFDTTILAVPYIVCIFFPLLMEVIPYVYVI